MLAPLPANEDDMLSRVGYLAQGVFLERAQGYDQASVFPSENFDDLFAQGLMAAPVAKKWGGLGLAPAYGKVFTLWQMTREIAKADLSFARCWEGHNNAMLLLDAMATDAQKMRWFEEVTKKGARWAAWSGEPQSKVPGQEGRVGTTIEPRDGGYLVNGNKVFASSAPGADWAILLVSLVGPGGARDASGGEDNLLLLACDLSDGSVSFDGDWWDPIGMRSTVSYGVNFNNTFISQENCIGSIGQYITQGFQACFTPHYAASFLGAASGAYDYAVEYISSQNKRTDPYVQHNLATIKINLETVELWLARVADKLSGKDQSAARLDGCKLRYLAEVLAEDSVKRCIKMCGARCLNKPSRLERIYRDLSIYTLHDNADHVLANIGRALLELPNTDSFFKMKA